MDFRSSKPDIMLNFLFRGLVSFWLITSIFVVPTSVANELDKQRSLFTAVERALKKGDTRPYWKHKTELSSYPLAPYLEYLNLSGNLRNLSQRELDRFSNKHPNLPQTDQLHRQWLRHLATTKQWKSYLEAYHHDDGGRYQCYKGIALKELGLREKAWREAKSLWLTGKSQHKSCDPLFKSWKSAGELTQSLITARFWMAVEQNNLSLARYLDNKITDAVFKPSTGLFWKIDKNPRVLASHFFIGELEHQRIIMLHGMKKLISRDYNLAIKTWLTLREQHPFTLEEAARVDQRIALKATKNFRADAEAISAKIDPDFQYHEVTEWRIRNALANQDWTEVIKLIEKLPPAIKNESRWRYWIEVAQLQFLEDIRKGKSAISTVSSTDKLKTPALNALSSERSFYAFLVADLKGVPFQLNHQSNEIRPQDIQKLKQFYPGLKRIREWTYHKRFYSAQSELNRITPGLTDSQKAMIPYLAQQWQWHFQAIMSAARAKLWDDLDLRFPAPESNLFNHHASKNDLDYPWVVAIARQESAFHPRARSHAGAMGLMQLMPATAKQAAKQAGITYRKNSELYKPEMNIALGTTHLGWLSKRFDNSRILATAAYNAGSTAVNRWLRQRGHLPLDIWIETIPYDETRKYVQNVMAFRVIYSQMGNQPVRMFSSTEVSSLSLNLNASPFIAQRDQQKP